MELFISVCLHKVPSFKVGHFVQGARNKLKIFLGSSQSPFRKMSHDDLHTVENTILSNMAL